MVSHHPIGSDTTRVSRPSLRPRPRHTISHLRNGHRCRLLGTTVQTFGDTPPACPLTGRRGLHCGTRRFRLQLWCGLPSAVDGTPCPITSVPPRPRTGEGNVFEQGVPSPYQDALARIRRLGGEGLGCPLHHCLRKSIVLHVPDGHILYLPIPNIQNLVGGFGLAAHYLAAVHDRDL